MLNILLQAPPDSVSVQDWTAELSAAASVLSALFALIAVFSAFVANRMADEGYMAQSLSS